MHLSMRTHGRPLGGLSFLLVATLLALAACGGKSKVQPPPPPPPPPAPPPELQVEVMASPTANRGPQGQGLPIVVRLYELKSQGSFAGADFFSLYDREGGVLGPDLIAREELTLAPGQSSTVEKPLHPDTRWLGVLGAFRDIDRAAWRALEPVAPGHNNAFVVEVGASGVRVTAR